MKDQKRSITLLSLPLQNVQLHEEYARLIPASYHCCLEGKDPFEIQSPVVGIGVLQDEHPIGITLATIYTKIFVARIHLFLLKDQNSNLAKQLLEALTRLLLEQGVTLATLTYTKEDPFSSTLEKAFLEKGWQGPRPLIVECLFKRIEFDPVWWYKNIELEKDFEEFPFKGLTRAEKEDLEHRYKQKSIPEYIYPFNREKDLIEYQNSLGLRYKGKVIGWIVTHRIARDVIRYSSLYLEEEFAHTRYWLKLLIDALKIHKEMKEATYGLLEINTEQTSTRWLKFIERKLFPQACKITHKEIFWKSLTTE